MLCPELFNHLLFYMETKDTTKNQPTEKEVRAEIEQNEKQTVLQCLKILNALCVAIALLPFVRMYIQNGKTEPIFESSSQKMVAKAIDKLIKQALKKLLVTIQTGTLNVWKNGETLSFSQLIGRVPEKTLKGLQEAGTFAHRGKAANKFIERKLRGLTLSDRVWKLENGIKTQIETTLQLSIIDGRSAIDTANDLKKYLKNPDILFRRVRDEAGNLQLSKAAREYHPGIGVYRSPFANAFRLARNEINNAYRAAHWNQIQEFDFVTGIKINLSNNHPVTDICDTLKGIYPKTFQWHGWHVQCRCHMTTELCSPAQLANLERGVKPPQIKELPESIKQWTIDNKHRVKPNENGKTGIEWIDSNNLIKSTENRR